MENNINIERRLPANAGYRAIVNEMTREQLIAELFTCELTGLQNRRGYEADVKGYQYQCAIDVDSLKWVNDNMGHEAGNELLRHVGRAIDWSTTAGYHVSGDEYFVLGDDAEELKDIMSTVSDSLKKIVIEGNDDLGRRVVKHGITLSWGIGQTFAEAEAGMYAHKKARELDGSRPARGKMPKSVSFLSDVAA